MTRQGVGGAAMPVSSAAGLAAPLTAPGAVLRDENDVIARFR